MFLTAMFNKLSQILSSRFGRRDELSRQLEIVKIFELFRQQVPGLGEPLTLRNKILTVRVGSSVAASELRFREAAIIAAVNAALGQEVIARIRYRVG